MCRAQRLTHIAITDHDTTAATHEAQAAAKDSGLSLLTGIELSAELARLEPATGREHVFDVHMLGYAFRLNDDALQGRLAALREDRLSRAKEIVERCGHLGMPIRFERVLAMADGGSVGRPHIARALVEAGYCSDVREAFDRWLHTGGPAYVARERLLPEEAIALIHAAGGVAVMAHPGLVKDFVPLAENLAREHGLDGIELMHPSNLQEDRLNIRGLAQRFDLLLTGGSDFHGEAVKPGIVPGQCLAPENSIAGIQERASRYATK
jgi:hypothetical protein